MNLADAMARAQLYEDQNEDFRGRFHCKSALITHNQPRTFLNQDYKVLVPSATNVPPSKAILSNNPRVPIKCLFQQNGVNNVTRAFVSVATRSFKPTTTTKIVLWSCADTTKGQIPTYTICQIGGTNWRITEGKLAYSDQPGESSYFSNFSQTQSWNIGGVDRYKQQ